MTPTPQNSVTETLVEEQMPPQPKFKVHYVWRNITLFVFLHLGALYGVYLAITVASWKTILFGYLLYVYSGLGITAGVHRLWSHKSYKARLPLRIFLTIANTVAFQNSIFEWSRDHRVHHKFSETDADPHNAKRGFFFAHMGWLFCRKHPSVIEKGRSMDLEDLYKDPVVMFQKKYYIPLMVMACFVLPTVVPVYFWQESISSAYFICALFRYTFLLHMTWLVNSAAHMFGHRPYNVHINPRENLVVSLGALGEGFHNYHHTFPWDYKASELGIDINFTTLFINTMALIGQAYDLRVVDKQIIANRRERTGDNYLKEN